MLPEDRWSIYRCALQAGVDSGVPFLLGGAMATAIHTGTWRGTNDMDLYILPQDRARMIEVLDGLGLQDLQEVLPYDPSMTYRAGRDGVIVELIWGFKNHRALVDDRWLARAHEIEVDGIPLRVTVGAKGLAKNSLELRRRADGHVDDLPIDTAAAQLKQIVIQAVHS